MELLEKCEGAEEKISKMKEIFKSELFEEKYIRELVAAQRGKINFPSKYYKGNIAEGNWSLIEKDDLDKLDKEKIAEKEIESKKVDALDVLLGRDKYPTKKELEEKGKSEKCAEYEYIFIPSYYAVKILITHYINDKYEAEKIYGLKNAVVRREGSKFYGGLPFILKYMRKLRKKGEIKFDFAEIMQELIVCKSSLKANKIEDDFINDIIDCIEKSCCTEFILEKRIKDFKDKKEEYYCVNFKEFLKRDEKLLEYITVDDYEILMHRDVEKDWEHLQKGEIKKANEKIRKTPKHPNNDSPKDSEALKGDLKGWFSQRITKKDRLVYRTLKSEKKVYIATVCDHYKNALGRSKTIASYK